MAQRYGGRYSPGARETAPAKPAPLDGKVPQRMAFRINLLFLAPVPLAIRAFFSEPVILAQYLAAAGLLFLAAWLTREGVKAEEAYDARKIARPPAFPRKLFATAATGLGLGFAGWAGFGPLEAGIFGILGAGLHLAAFGIDPMRAKGVDEHGDFQTDRVARVVEEAEEHLSAIRASIETLRDRQLTERVDGFLASVRQLCRRVEDDPRGLTGARKYLGVYLLGARDATAKFADLYRDRKDADARADYTALLDDLEQSFAARTEKMLLDDRSDLDIEIDVLRERLAREGVRSE